MFVRLYSGYPSEIRDVAMHGSSPKYISNLRGEADASQKSEVRSQKSEDSTATSRRYRPWNTSAVRTSSRSLHLTNADALNAAPNAATRSGNFFLVQRTRFSALLEMILRGIGMKTHF